MIGFCQPAEAGFSQSALEKFDSTLRRAEVNLHSALMLRGEHIFYERYWAPFTAQTPHRMYSVTKSFTSAAIGCLIDEGRLSLDDRIVDFFPDKLPGEVPELLARQTIRDMLTMHTCFAGFNWFRPEVADRTAYYFAQRPVKPAGSLFDYDSNGSFILGVLVERLSGETLLNYLKRKLLDRIGGFENAQMLQTPEGSSWGDSALLCTPRALLNFARFVMNRGTWEGERLLSETYLRDATRPLRDNNLECRRNCDRWGYGYQVWATEQNGFAFNGMGGQYAICVPERDFIFVCTGDNQMNDAVTAPIVFRAVFDLLDECLPRPAAQPDLPPPQLPPAHGAPLSPFAAEIDGARFVCEANPMGISEFRLTFPRPDEGCFEYVNAQGRKHLPFGMGRNHFGKFPQLGYSNQRGNVHDLTDFRYGCAASAGWLESRKLQLRVQIVDRYFGSLIVTFGFVEDGLAGVRMVKCAEDFLNEYEGWMIARRAD